MAFIVFEGGDGAGKSTQCRSLLQRLLRRGYPVRVTREPGGTPLGESLRRLLKSRRDISTLSELLLFEAARFQLVEQVIRPALVAGETVICDRFTASSLAYQGYGRGLDLGLIYQLNGYATGGISPDLTVWLDLPVEVGLARRSKSDGDTFDGASPEFHQKVRQGYSDLSAQNPSKWLVLDATQPPRELARTIWTKVQPLL
ncbi:MAG: dTMP kinase [Chloroflexi bacterium]|nr:dTMP kinase [Chloroflexota bacterium]MDA1218415.1 dTMP kinase [Chloroflexota bacterium]